MRFKEIEACLGGSSLTGSCFSEIAKVSVSLGVGRRLLPPACLAVSRGTLGLALQAWTPLRSAPGVLPAGSAPCTWR